MKNLLKSLLQGIQLSVLVAEDNKINQKVAIRILEQLEIVPDIAENGAVVPVTVSTDMADVESISVVVDNNPTPLAASFEMSSRTPPSVSVRIKMGQSSNVQAVVKAGGKLYSTSKEVKVTIGGCGG